MCIFALHKGDRLTMMVGIPATAKSMCRGKVAGSHATPNQSSPWRRPKKTNAHKSPGGAMVEYTRRPKLSSKKGKSHGSRRLHTTYSQAASPSKGSSIPRRARYMQNPPGARQQHVRTDTHVHVCAHTQLRIAYVFECIWIRAYVYVCICIYTHTCIYVCMSVPVPSAGL